LKALRVLVVEDNALLGLLLSELLESLGHEVCDIAATEADAVTAANRFAPDLMIVDVQLGDGDGIAAVAEICRTRHVAHLFVTGEPLTVMAAKPDAVVLRKPFREAELTQAMQRAMGAAFLA
jgi:CheY-like chemotaxis protein